MWKNLLRIILGGIICTAVACKNNDATNPPEDAIAVGALLPFSGEHAAVGLNLEQAVSLAVRDVNQAGGINGRRFFLVSRDSNSGSDKGYQQAQSLLYDEKIPYLIGPEENALAKKLVPDVKKLDILNILPGFAAPVIRETGKKGGWLRLAPSPSEVGCAMALHALASGYTTASALISADDYQTQLASEFNTYFVFYGGRSLGTMTVKPDSDNYLQQVDAIKSLDAELSLLLAYPTTASEIMQEWAIIGNDADWYFSPTLYTEMFLQNIPIETENADIVFSPARSLTDECEIENETDTIDDDTDKDAAANGEDTGVADAGDLEIEIIDLDQTVRYTECRQDNRSRFATHFGDYWGSDTPLPASVFYYDAVVLLAFGLTAAATDGHPNPTPSELRDYIRQIAEAPGQAISWADIADGFERIREGKDILYLGAAAQYQFDGAAGKTSYGLAQHQSIDIWNIEQVTFDHNATIGVTCANL